MRWKALFDDLEAQLEASDQAELAAEVRDRSRREAGLIRTVDRLRAGLGQPLAITVAGGGTVRAALVGVGEDWLLLEEPDRRAVLLPAAAVLSIAGLGRRTEPSEGQGVVAARLDLRWAMRGLARNRAGVQITLLDGTPLVGTLDRIGADHVELAEHAVGEARRAAAVQGVRLVPLHALALLRQL